MYIFLTHIPIVAPFVGVWIEIADISNAIPILASLPSWECGLKCLQCRHKKTNPLVAPFVGVWIEILHLQAYPALEFVAPFVGVWIEITT